ncbi:Lysophospholipase 1 [Yarrowia sp. C11]|nr:Lysophospholipase 1 [Yarrowia sp. C11]KAG5364494.1 Lysophospholipase 1 [Yarrowia sp. E02]
MIANFLLLLVLVAFVQASYTPTRGSCGGNTNLLREASGISPGEASYVASKQSKSDSAFQDYLKHVNIPGLDVNQSANIGLSFSGGGYRAMLAGAGEFSALDSRNEIANTMGGLLQASNYIVGCSGGGWLVGTIAMNNFPTIAEVRSNPDLWELSDNVPELTNPRSWRAFGRYAGIVRDTLGKRLAGFRISFTDEWGLLVGRGIVDRNGPYSTWSDIKVTQSYLSNEIPFPIIVGTTLNSADERQAQITIDNPLLEMTPIEFGSYDKSIKSFFTTSALGTSVSNGQPTSSQCVTGFDNAKFLLGTTSSLFQGVSGWQKALLNIVGAINGNLGPSAIYHPNPFQDASSVQAPFNSETLYATDGGYSGMVAPLWPLMQPSRKIDLVYSFDNSAGGPNNAPDGVSLDNVKQKVISEMGEGVFPEVPSSEEFMASYLVKPVWVGCEVSKLKKIPNSDRYVPLIITMANHEINYNSLTNTVKMDYSSDEQTGMISNGFAIASSNGDLKWAQCVGCAGILREFQRTGQELPETCKACLKEYCYQYSG